MKKLLSILLILGSFSTLAERRWDTELCLELFGENEDSRSDVYSDQVDGHQITISEVSQLDDTKTEQLLSFFRHALGAIDPKIYNVIISNDDEKITYVTLKVIHSQKIYVRVQAWFGGNEQSVIFADQEFEPIAFTLGGDCYQES